MTVEQKQSNRYKFRVKAFYLVVATMLIGAGLAVAGTSGFEAIAIGVFGFAGAVFAADYATKVSMD